MVFMRFVTHRLVDEKMKETNLEFLLFWNFFGFFFFSIMVLSVSVNLGGMGLRIGLCLSFKISSWKLVV